MKNRWNNDFSTKSKKNQTHNHSTTYFYLEMISKSHNDWSHGTKVSKWCLYFRNSCNWSSFALSNVSTRWSRTSNKCNNIHWDCEYFSIIWKSRHIELNTITQISLSQKKDIPSIFIYITFTMYLILGY